MGPELRYLHHDAYLPLLGDKHPALGLRGDEVWHEIWDTIGPMLESVLSTGQATWPEDLLLPMRRHDYLVKPFAAGELLARVRSTVELARMGGHHARWRAALVDSLHEAFFLCDGDGDGDGDGCRGQLRLR
ncbi:MAG TPA: hypothetical protein VHZ03_07740 [Trebonia sp.]|nr:hypothetical protein [Trebonia sp.]